MDDIRVAKVDNVILESFKVDPEAPDAIPFRKRTTGTLHLTPHHLVFSPSSTSASTSSTPSTEVWISYPAITLLTRLPQSMQGLYPLQIRTRTFENYVMLFDKDRDGGAEDVWQSVKDCAVVSSVERLYAFNYTLPSTVTTSSGWSTYNPRTEFARQGLGTRTKAWRFTDVNKEYTFCPTYPSKLVVPSRISDSVLAHAAKYRSKARIPALAYLHWGNHASITRSSQPMVGLKNARSAQDERLIECIFSAHLFQDNAYAAPQAGPETVYGSTSTNLIIDARPTTNAMANVAMGAGTENMDNYRTGKKAYLGIDNIHVMRNSLKTIDEAIREAETNPGAMLDRGLLRKSNWLRHISTLLDGALVITKNIHLNASHVLIHCSDGWDRTSQLSATAQICLDPYYRTLDGFKILVEKDWLSFGHKFLDRSGHLSSEKLFTVADVPEDDSDDEFGGAQKAAQAFFASMQKQFTSNNHLKETSPVFHQFLDCVWQIMRQYPARFEFNEDFLLEMYRHTYSCQYGTFLFNNERERRVPHSGRPYIDRTVSIWDQVDADRQRYLNPSYDPSLDDRASREPEADQGVLLPDPKDVRFWYRLFRRGDEEMNGSALTLAQGQGADAVGPLGSGQVDPISIEGVVDGQRGVDGPSTGRVASPLSHTPDPLSASVSSRMSKSPDSQGQSPGQGWRGGWSQFSSGAFSAIQGAAREFRSLGQEAMRRGDEDTSGANGGMWAREKESGATSYSSAPASTAFSSERGSSPSVGFRASRLPSAGPAAASGPSRVSGVRIPSEANPWALSSDTSSSSSGLPRTTATSTPTPSSSIPPVTGQAQTDGPATPALPPKIDGRNPWTSQSQDRLDLSALSLDDKSARASPAPQRPQTPAKPVSTAQASSAEDEEVKAALGQDQKAWDPLGAL